MMWVLELVDQYKDFIYFYENSNDYVNEAIEILENKKITELVKNSAKNINFINSLTELSSNNFDIFHCHS
mgnify:CR=1 FL=1